MKKFLTYSFLTLLLSAFTAGNTAAQIFEVNIDVNTSQISASSGLDYIDQLGPLIRDYFEETNWTDDRYQENERIRINIQVVLNSVDGDVFNANFVIQSERPIYGTMSVTPLVIINDNNWNFTFNRSQTLVKDNFQYDNIASLLDFYAYIILGYDYDSFSPLGGQEYFRNAQSVLEVAQSSGATGWSSGSSRRNRYHLVTQLLNPNYEDFRLAFYQYHRQGLDRFLQNPERARQNVLEAFDTFRQAQRMNTDRYPFDLLFTAKNREFTAFFIDAEPNIRLQAYNILTELDTGNISEYEKLQ